LNVNISDIYRPYEDGGNSLNRNSNFGTEFYHHDPNKNVPWSQNLYSGSSGYSGSSEFSTDAAGRGNTLSSKMVNRIFKFLLISSDVETHRPVGLRSSSTQQLSGHTEAASANLKLDRSGVATIAMTEESEQRKPRRKALESFLCE